MSARPTISVIVPTYNRRTVLPRAIASVLAQTEPDFELIIVDDASTDDTKAYLATLSDPRIRVIGGDRTRNLGVSGARNLGLAAARADIVAFLDSDDAYRPPRLARALAMLAEDTSTVCTLSSALKQMRNEVQHARLPDVRLGPAAFEWSLYSHLFPVEATAITLRRDDATAIGGFNPALSMTEDREFLIRLAPRGALRLMPEIDWEKSWSLDGLSMQWHLAGPGLLAYFEARPEYRARYPKIASYLATKTLVADIRDGLWSSLWRDLRQFRAAGLLAGGPWRLWRDHRAVRHYRRAMSKPDALAALAGPPEDWRRTGVVRSGHEERA